MEEAILALLHLNSFEDSYGWRAWKSFDWDALDRLHGRGLIGTEPTEPAPQLE